MAMCWGANYYGQSTPPEDTFIQISAGTDFTCGLKGDGSISCWGTGKNTLKPPYDVDISGHRIGNDYGQALPPVEESLTQPQLDAAKQAGIEQGISQTKASFETELNAAKQVGIQEGINQCKAQQVFGGGTATQKAGRDKKMGDIM